MAQSDNPLDDLLVSIRACTTCANDLANGVRPVVQAAKEAKILIAGQAPGVKVHTSGVPFDDASGDRLRHWMGIDRKVFYSKRHVAIAPMGFCYPGKGKSGDLPPRPICATQWRNDLLAHLPNIALTLVIGQYAQRWHLPEMRNNVTATVRAWRDYGSHILPLPHPSPRNNIWLKKNPWFEKDVLPTLRQRVADALNV